MNTKKIGDFGEDAACRFLKQNGYDIIGRNYCTRYGEIDIIAEKGEYIVFVEVKTRKNAVYGLPSEFVGTLKRERIIKSAYQYLDGRDAAVRFDVIEVIYRQKTAYIRHIENAFGEDIHENI